MFKYLFITILIIPSLTFANQTSNDTLEALGVQPPTAGQSVCRALVGTSLENSRMVNNLPVKYCEHRATFPRPNLKVLALGDFYTYSPRIENQPVNNTSNSTRVACRMRMTVALPKNQPRVAGVPVHTNQDASTRNIYFNHMPEEVCIPDLSFSIMLDSGEIVQSVGEPIIYDFHLVDEDEGAASR